MKKVKPSIPALTATFAVVVDLMVPSGKVPLHVRCIEACETMQVLVRRDGVDDMLRVHICLSGRGEGCPLVSICFVPICPPR